MANVILENANNVTLTRRANTRRAVSNSGYARIERSGPTFYGLEIDLPILETNNYRAVNNALITLDDGINFLETTLPTQFRITNLQGPRPTGTIGTQAATGGTSVTLTGITGTLTAGDFIQFSGSTKVYQITETVTASGDEMTITLNTGLIAPITTSTTVRLGDEVEFRFLLSESPSVNIIPKNRTDNLYLYSTINLQEVL